MFNRILMYVCKVRGNFENSSMILISAFCTLKESFRNHFPGWPETKTWQLQIYICTSKLYNIPEEVVLIMI